MTAPMLRATGTAALLAALPTLLTAQTNLYPQASAVSGVEARQYGFDSKFGVDHVRQIAVPIAIAVPLGRRFSFDIGTWYASTSVKSTGGGTETFSSLTDTQLRLAYVLGNDAIVASVVVNLPTGKETTTQQQFGIAAGATSNFLLFPVNTYGTAASVTPGLAAATSLGDWNVGISGSLRYTGEYKPFNDGSDPDLKYQPGLEGRVRLGVDRLVGKGRFTIGGTFSTFSNDELTPGTGSSGTYSPGNRFIVDASLVAPAGSGTVSFYAWNYHRARSSSSNGVIGGKENILTGGVAGAFPLGAKLSLEPMVEARLWSPETGKGSLYGAGTGLRIQLSPALAFVPSGRVDAGSIRLTDSGSSSSIFAWDASAMLRYTF